MFGHHSAPRESHFAASALACGSPSPCVRRLAFAFVTRVLRRAGTPRSDIDDEVQRTFIVATRRLDDIRPGAERGFLFRIALNLAAHARRTAARRREVASDQAGEQVERLATPEALTDRKMTRDLLNSVIDQMNATWRATFVLCDLEEMSMPEVAKMLGIPRGTVASRLRCARNEFRARLAAIDGFGDAPQGQIAIQELNTSAKGLVDRRAATPTATTGS